MKRMTTMKQYFFAILTLLFATVQVFSYLPLEATETKQFAQGDYDILVNMNGVLVHPENLGIEQGWYYNDGYIRDLPKGWINGLNEEQRTQLYLYRSTVEMRQMTLARVTGNGYTTIINELFVNNVLGWCDERAKNPVSFAQNYNDGTRTDHNKSDSAIWIGYNDVFGMMQGLSHEARFAITQAAIWHFGSNLDYSATLTLADGTDLSQQYRAVVDRVNVWSAEQQTLLLNKQNETIQFDKETRTLVSGAFYLANESIQRPVTLQVPADYYVTEATNNVAVSTIEKGKQYVLRTKNISANETIQIQASVALEAPYGVVFSHNNDSSLQNIRIFGGNDDKRLETTLAFKFTPATFNMQIQKLITQTYPEIQQHYDMTAFVFRVTSPSLGFVQDISMRADGTNILSDLVYATDYTVQEIATPKGVKLDNKAYPIDVTAGQTHTYTLTNPEELWHLEIMKKIDRIAGYNVSYDMTAFVFQLESKTLNYKQTIRMDKNGKGTLKNLVYATDYTIQELTVPFGIEQDTNKYPIDIKSGATYQYNLVNKEQPTWLNFIKKDVNQGYVPHVVYAVATDVLRKQDGSYQLDKDGNLQLDEAKIIFKNLETQAEKNLMGTIKSTAIPSGLKGVYVQEVAVPDHIVLDSSVRYVELKENSTVDIEYLNNIRSEFIVEGYKTDELGKPLSDMVFYIKRPDGQTIQTLRTDTKGFFRSRPLQLKDINNNYIEYILDEKPTALFKPFVPIPFTGKNKNADNVVIFKAKQLVNYYKEIQFVLPKILETNPYGLTADGTVFELKNSKTDKVVATAVVKDGLATFSKYKLNLHTNGSMVYYEKKAPDFIQQDPTVYQVPDVDVTAYNEGTLIYLRTQDNPLINRLKPVELKTTATAVDGKKYVPTNTQVDVFDKVNVCNLIKDKQYTIYGELIDKTTGKPFIDIDGQHVQQTFTFIAKGDCETISMRFKLNTANITPNTELVFYEYLYYNPTGKVITTDDKPIVSHTDINDVGQTITVKDETLVQTGTTNRYIYLAMMLLFLGLASYLIVRIQQLHGQVF